jgi:hypothetical protein
MAALVEQVEVVFRKKLRGGEGGFIHGVTERAGY